MRDLYFAWRAVARRAPEARVAEESRQRVRVRLREAQGHLSLLREDAEALAMKKMAAQPGEMHVLIMPVRGGATIPAWVFVLGGKITPRATAPAIPPAARSAWYNEKPPIASSNQWVSGEIAHRHAKLRIVLAAHHGRTFTQAALRLAAVAAIDTA